MGGGGDWEMLYQGMALQVADKKTPGNLMHSIEIIVSNTV